MLALVLGSGLAPAAAATEGDWATWSPVTGAAGGWSATVTLPGVGGPVATVTSTASSAERVSGASTWLGPATPPGAEYGSSRDRAYLSQRPAANNPGSPSITTYTFDTPPPVGWAFVLGDIDADEATVSAVTGGRPATAAELGFQAGPGGPTSGFNLCRTTPRPSSLCAAPTPSDVPTWDPATATLRGNAAAADTDGAGGWFRPTVPLTSLTISYRWRSGFPIYQTWLAGQTRTVAGRLTGPAGCDPTTATITLRAGSVVLARVTPAADGRWRVPEVAARDGLTVRLEEPPAGCRLLDAPSPELAVDPTSADDVDLDLAVERPPGAEETVTGTLRDTTGAPVAGAVITLTGPDDDPQPEPERVVTDDQGRLEATLPPGRYDAVLTPPAAYAADDAAVVLTVPVGGGPVDLGFVVRRVAPPPATLPASPAPSASASARPVPAPSSGMLPDTGGPSGALLPGGASLLVLGSALLTGVARGSRRAQRARR